jgi:predicted DsbA family dithiol-disulfide isomerase
MKLAIDVIGDLASPWCFIACERLDQALAKYPKITPEIVYVPYVLDATVPKPSVDLREFLKKSGGDADAVFARAEHEARASDVPLDFAKVRVYPNTVAAQTIVRHAHARGTQRALVKALFHAYFLDGEDIGRNDTLISIGSEHGFSRREVRAIVEDEPGLNDTKRAVAAVQHEGVMNVPLFVFEQRDSVGGLPTVRALELRVRDFLIER